MMTSNYVDKQRQQEIADLWSTKIPLPRLLFIRFVLCNYDSCYENLLTAASVPSIRIDLLRSLATDVFKFVNGLNPYHLNEMIYKKKSNPYELRDTSILSRPKVNYSHYGLKTFSSYVEYTACFIEIGSISLWIQTNGKIMGWPQWLLLHLYPIHMNLKEIYSPTMVFAWLCDVFCEHIGELLCMYFSWIRFPFMYIILAYW